jgi:hypothetical protein
MKGPERCDPFFVDLLVQTADLTKGMGMSWGFVLFAGLAADIGDKRHDHVARHPGTQ